MGLFDAKDGPGDILIKYCGYIKGSNGSVTEGYGSQILQPAKDSKDAKQILSKFVNKGYLKDASGKPLSSGEGYEIGSYSYTKIPNSKPVKYYHSFWLVNEENDHYCRTSGGRKRRTRKSRGKKSRKTRRTRKY